CHCFTAAVIAGSAGKLAATARQSFPASPYCTLLRMRSALCCHCLLRARRRHSLSSRQIKVASSNNSPSDMVVIKPPYNTLCCQLCFTVIPHCQPARVTTSNKVIVSSCHHQELFFTAGLISSGAAGTKSSSS